MSAFVAVWDHEECVTLVTVDPRHTGATVVQHPGSRHPISAGAPGIAIQSAVRTGMGRRRPGHPLPGGSGRGPPPWLCGEPRRGHRRGLLAGGADPGSGRPAGGPRRRLHPRCPGSGRGRRGPHRAARRIEASWGGARCRRRRPRAQLTSIGPSQRADPSLQSDGLGGGRRLPPALPEDDGAAVPASESRAAAADTGTRNAAVE